MRNDSGEITHFVVIELDVANRNRAHAELAQRLQELTALNHLFQEHLARRDELEGNLADLASTMDGFAEDAATIGRKIEEWRTEFILPARERR